jgi:hypothetical protein
MSKRRWIAAYIELQEGFWASDIIVSTVRLNSEIVAEAFFARVGDYDGDGITDLMVRFERVSTAGMSGDVVFSVTGELGEAVFIGADSVRILGG